jgi:hypothetical protein
MTLPANIRVNAQLPFPSLVVGSGPITIGKQNGIWTVGFSINAFGSIVPPVPNYPTDYLLGYDATNSVYFKVSITNLIASINQSIAAVRAQRSVTATPIVVGPTDQILNCNINAPAACTLPLAASRQGVPLTFKEVGGHAVNYTFTPAGGDTIDGGGAMIGIAGARGYITFVPFNDGVNTGWAVE